MLTKSKVIRSIVLFVFLFITLFSSNMVIPVQAYTDVSNMTDQTFFGVWDNNNSIWTLAGKLDYGNFPGLAAVQTDVKAGNYTQAKADLLTYYRNRTTRTMPGWGSSPTSLQVLKAQLEAEDFIFSGDDYPLGIVHFTATDATISTVVTEAVNAALARTGQVCFMIMGRNRVNNAASICSSEGSVTNQPHLVLNLVGGGQQILNVNNDAFIRPTSTYGDTNYGFDSELSAKEYGPLSNATRRAYVMFDMSSLGLSSISSASLQLYGHAVSGTYDVVVVNSGNTGFDESTITWNNTEGYTYTWTGVSGGTDWENPPYSNDMFSTTAVRFSMFNEMVPTYSNTHDEYYASNMIRLWLDFITDKGNADPIANVSLDGGARADVMVSAYDVLKSSPSLDASANTAMLKYFWQMANSLADPAHFHSTKNWGIYESQGLYQISLYFPEFTASSGSSGWVQLAKTRVKDVILYLTNSDGSYTEAAAGYAAGAVTGFAYVKQIGAMNNDYFDTAFDARLQDLGRYVMDLSRPDGNQASFGDSDADLDTTAIINNLASTYPSRPDLLYFGSKGTQGTASTTTTSIYPVGKSIFMRTGYNPNDMFMSIDLNDGVHAHPDLNSVTAYAFGRNLLVDPGVYIYDTSNPPNPITAFLQQSTKAHNTIEMDNKAQAYGKGSGVYRILEDYCTNNIFDFIDGDHNGYSGHTQTRDVFFIRGKYWIVSDWMESTSGTHDYNQTWHFHPSANLTINGTTKKSQTAFSSGANIQVVPVDPSSITATVQSGYYSSYGGSYATANYTSYAKSTITGDVTFDTVLFPTQSTDTNRDVKVTRLTITPSVATKVATAFKIDTDFGHNGNIGYYYLSHEYVPVTARTFDTYNFNGKAAYVETNYQGSYVMAAVKTGTLLKNGSTNLISSPAMINDLGVKWNGTTLDISGSQLIPDAGTSTAVAIYAPSATTVIVNGNAVPFTRSGNYIYAAKAVTGFYPTSDAYVRGGSYANTSFPVTDNLAVKGSTTASEIRCTYLKFDTNKFTGTTTSAKLRLCVKATEADASRTIKIYGTTDKSWSENSLVFNSPAGTTYIGSITIANTDVNKWIEVDVSNYVKAQGDKIASFLMQNEGPATATNLVDFYSKDSAVNKPLLVIK